MTTTPEARAVEPRLATPEVPLLLATTNPAKLVRLRWVVEGLPYATITPADLPPGQAATVPEDGASFAGNARQKAEAWSSAAGGMLALASDGGLEVPALGERWQALRTRRNAGEGARSCQVSKKPSAATSPRQNRTPSSVRAN